MRREREEVRRPSNTRGVLQVLAWVARADNVLCACYQANVIHHPLMPCQSRDSFAYLFGLCIDKHYGATDTAPRSKLLNIRSS